MRHLTYVERDTYKYLFLVSDISQYILSKYYFGGYPTIRENSLIIDTYSSPTDKKTSADDIRQYMKESVVPVIKDFGIEVIVTNDSSYFKTLSKKTKVDAFLGYKLDTEYGVPVMYIPSPNRIKHDPIRVQAQIEQVLSFLGGNTEPGQNIIGKSEYPNTFSNVKVCLDKLHQYDQLTCDIETFSLKPHLAGIASIGFAWNKHDGIAFQVDRSPNEPNKEIRALLKEFFQSFSGTLIFHNISFDATVLIYQLWMEYLSDQEGLLEGLKYMLKNFEDTKLITYLATNTCAGNHLGLKELSQEYAGNYAQEEIADVTKIPINQLLEYNLKDCLATWFVYDKYYPKMVQDGQFKIYTELFKPSVVDIVQMQLTGLPLNMARVKEVKAELENTQNKALDTIFNSKYVTEFNEELRIAWTNKRNQELKVKKVTVNDAPKVMFNPNSNQHKQGLFYEYLKLPVINYTDSGLPSTDTDTIKSLMNQTKEGSIKTLLGSFVAFNEVAKILTAFIPVFEEAPYDTKTDWHYLLGNFNLGGTVSGRMTSNRPNLQQLPATGSAYAKVIKSCFQAPKGWLFTGLDFSALEDHISALITKDKNKLKVYTDNYDGHCLRAYSYFSEQMPDITKELAEHPENEVEIINSIKHRYKHLRQLSKGPTFCLTYAGTSKALMDIFGFSEEEALSIERKYHELYQESDRWVAERIAKAKEDGYVTVALGLRVRTPLLADDSISDTNPAKSAEARTAGNALGQSYCMLTNRSSVEFNTKARTEKYKNDIKLMVHIHDAQYYLIKDDIDVIEYVNTNLVKAVEWQDDPAIAHPDVHLGGEFSIFYPTWKDELTIPNHATKEEIKELAKKHVESLNDH